MSDKLKIVLGSLLSVVLVVVLVFEARTLLGMVSTQHFREIGDMSTKIKREVAKSVHIDEAYEWPDAPAPESGDTLRIPGTKVKVKVSGTLTSKNIADTGMVTYTNPETNLAETLMYQIYKSDSTTAEEIRAAMYEYAYGNAEALFQQIPDSAYATSGSYQNQTNWSAPSDSDNKPKIEVKKTDEGWEVKRTTSDGFTATQTGEGAYVNTEGSIVMDMRTDEQKEAEYEIIHKYVSDDVLKDVFYGETRVTIDDVTTACDDGYIDLSDADRKKLSADYLEYVSSSSENAALIVKLTQLSEGDTSVTFTDDEEETFYNEVTRALSAETLTKIFGTDKPKIKEVVNAVSDDSFEISKEEAAGLSVGLMSLMMDGMSSSSSGDSSTITDTDSETDSEVMDLINELGTEVVDDAESSTEETVDTGEAEFYMQKRYNGNVPIIFDPATGHYTMFVAEDYNIVFIQASSPFVISDDTVSVTFPNPKDDPMYSHNYDMYETTASINTQRELLEGEDGEEADASYESGAVAGTAETYTAKSDNNKRKMMATYGDHKWNKDGTSKTTSAVIDTTSMEAKKSEWVLTSTTYSYTYAGLQVSNVEAKRSSTEFIVSGNINNLLESDRPYVLVIKLLNSNGDLLGVHVIDGRQKPIGGKNVMNFYATIKSTELGVGTDTITAVQFEVY